MHDMLREYYRERAKRDIERRHDRAAEMLAAYGGPPGHIPDRQQDALVDLLHWIEHYCGKGAALHMTQIALMHLEAELEVTKTGNPQ